MGASSSRSSSAAPRVPRDEAREDALHRRGRRRVRSLPRARGRRGRLGQGKKSSAPSALAPATAKSDGGVFSPSRSHPTVTTLISDLQTCVRRPHRVLHPLARRVPLPRPRAQLCRAFPDRAFVPVSPLAEHGVLDDLDDVAADVAARKVSLLNVPAPLLELPNAPHKTRNKSILRRNNTSAGETATGETSARPTARRLTWNDAKGVPGETLERVQIFDENDAMGTCSRSRTRSARRNSTGSTASFSSEESRAVSAYRVALAELPTAADDGRALVSSLDAEARDTVRRIGEQLAEYGTARGATADLDPTDRRAFSLGSPLPRGRRHRRRQRAPRRRRVRDAEVREFHLGRSVTTAGDALLAYVSPSPPSGVRRSGGGARRGVPDRHPGYARARPSPTGIPACTAARCVDCSAISSRSSTRARARRRRDRPSGSSAPPRREGGGGESGGTPRPLQRITLVARARGTTPLPRAGRRAGILRTRSRPTRPRRVGSWTARARGAHPARERVRARARGGRGTVAARERKSLGQPPRSICAMLRQGHRRAKVDRRFGEVITRRESRRERRPRPSERPSSPLIILKRPHRAARERDLSVGEWGGPARVADAQAPVGARRGSRPNRAGGGLHRAVGMTTGASTVPASSSSTHLNDDPEGGEHERDDRGEGQHDHDLPPWRAWSKFSPRPPSRGTPSPPVWRLPWELAAAPDLAKGPPAPGADNAPVSAKGGAPGADWGRARGRGGAERARRRRVQARRRRRTPQAFAPAAGAGRPARPRRRRGSARPWAWPGRRARRGPSTANVASPAPFAPVADLFVSKGSWNAQRLLARHLPLAERAREGFGRPLARLRHRRRRLPRPRRPPRRGRPAQAPVAPGLPGAVDAILPHRRSRSRGATTRLAKAVPRATPRADIAAMDAVEIVAITSSSAHHPCVARRRMGSSAPRDARGAARWGRARATTTDDLLAPRKRATEIRGMSSAQTFAGESERVSRRSR